jgi:predicted Fe-Mo cluster-binding NifX family protein
VSPLFDAAGTLVFVDVEDGREVGRRELTFSTEAPLVRALRVVGERADVLICGAISPSLSLVLRAGGVEVLAEVCGPLNDVLAAFLRGNLLSERTFRMPGCRGGARVRRRWRGGRSDGRRR